jgi:putative two-component system response regulator
MAAERGRHFDPDLLDLFLAGFDEFGEIARRYPDEPAGPAPTTATGAAA